MCDIRRATGKGCVEDLQLEAALMQCRAHAHKIVRAFVGGAESSSISFPAGWVVGMPTELALSGEHLWSSRHPATAPQWSKDVHSSWQELEGDHAKSTQVSQLHQIRNTPWYTIHVYKTLSQPVAANNSFPYKMKGSRLYYRHYLQVYWTHSRTITVCWSRFRSVWRTIWSKRDYFSLGSTFSLMMSCLKSYHRRETLRQSSPTFENASMPFLGTWKCICICITCTCIPPILSIPQSWIWNNALTWARCPSNYH